MNELEAIVGVVGACGQVGRVATSRLAILPRFILRLGARERESAVRLIGRLDAARAQPMQVNVFDEDSLRRFSAGCDIVVNCAGPSNLIGDRVARAARHANAHYVDAAADASLQQRLIALKFEQASRSALIGAGMQPGLSEILPWYIAQGYDPGGRLVVHAGGLDRITESAAEDYLQLLASDFGSVNMAWECGRRIAIPSGTLRSIQLPFFSGEATAVPFLSRDAERISRQLLLAKLQWHTVFIGRHVHETLSLTQPHRDCNSAAKNLVRAAELDLFGHQPYQLFVLELSGTIRGETRHRTVICRGSSATALTGLMVAHSVLQVLDHATPPGASFAADVLAGDRVISWLRDTEGIVMATLDDSSPALGLELQVGTVA